MNKEDFRNFISSKGLKITKKRDEIFDEVLNTKGHFDPEELYMRLKQKGSKVSRASIYRTIPLLVEIGLIEEVERVDKHAHYERVSADSHHDHMICMKCGKVIEFFSPTLEMLQDEICQRENFHKIRHSLEIFGLCKQCQ
ncbi:MAG: transcriptional repressor [Thermodesulfovibrionales bacterium]|nr:transcriptional repressor [Thermodesulfovibrionales bacterium]